MRIVLLVALTGCDQLWNIQRLELMDDARSDGRGDNGGFDPQRDCPDDYVLDLVDGSRHRLVPTGNAFVLSDACEVDAPGLTHLAVMSSPQEAMALEAIAVARNAAHFIGAVQSRMATTIDGGWLWLTGESVTLAQWASTSIVEPNDFDGHEADHSEQFGGVWQYYPGLVDFDPMRIEFGICECDGRPIAAAARAALDSNRGQTP